MCIYCFLYHLQRLFNEHQYYTVYHCVRIKIPFMLLKLTVYPLHSKVSENSCHVIHTKNSQSPLIFLHAFTLSWISPKIPMSPCGQLFSWLSLGFLRKSNIPPPQPPICLILPNIFPVLLYPPLQWHPTPGFSLV